MSDIHQILEKYWGFKSFRPLQEDIINAVLSGEDTLALLPTGGGKSICFQVPALKLDGICIVITPLIALMKDQVQNLKKRNIKAVAIYSGMSKREIDITLDNCAYGDIKFLYCSPERLKTDIFQERVKKMDVGLLAIDEAHCISQWGYDFRPSYLQIAEFRSLIPNTTCIALTATATEQVCTDIQNRLDFKKENIFRKSFARKNLSYSCFYTENKETKLLDILNKVPGSSVVYVRNRNKTKTVAQFLQTNLVSADYYHGGLDNDIRSRKQQDWIEDKIRVVVSTNAFGMGIDKPDVRTVIHLDIPDHPEAYYQEAGRAGRDELIAYAVLLYDKTDFDGLTERIEISHPDIKEIKNTYQALCNFFKLAIGSAMMESFEINLIEFSHQYNFDVLKTYNSIKILESQGLIQFNEGLALQSKLNILVDQKTLYEFQVANKHLDQFIKSVLRIYGGELFGNYLNISEQKISKLLNLSSQEVVKNLMQLRQHNIVDYIRHSGQPIITFLVPRQDVKNLPIDVQFLKNQKKLALQKATTMIDYAKSTRRCRTQLLLEYFDEITDEKCGVCDNCLQEKKVDSFQSKQKNIESSLIQMISEKPTRIDVIKEKLSMYKQEELSEVIAVMLENGIITIDDSQYVSLK